jgi:hypothetical protein
MPAYAISHKATPADRAYEHLALPFWKLWRPDAAGCLQEVRDAVIPPGLTDRTQRRCAAVVCQKCICTLAKQNHELFRLVTDHQAEHQSHSTALADVQHVVRLWTLILDIVKQLPGTQGGYHLCGCGVQHGGDRNTGGCSAGSRPGVRKPS